MRFQDDDTPKSLPQSIHFPRHLMVFLAALAIVLVLNLGLGAGLPLFWLFAAWSVVLAIHFFIASSKDVREEWFEDKAEELRSRSYDFEHIRDIRDRMEQRDHSVVHHEERKD